MIAEGQRQSSILSAGGEKESSILRAQGDREAAVLRAQADRQAQMLRAEGEAQAIGTVFNAIHAGQPDQGLLAYQYLQMLPSLAKGDANKVWIVPSELNEALKGLGGVVGGALGNQAGAPERQGIPAAASGEFTAPPRIDVQAEIEEQALADQAQSDKTVAEAIAAAQELENPVRPGGGLSTPAVTTGPEPAAPDGANGADGANGVGGVGGADGSASGAHAVGEPADSTR